MKAKGFGALAVVLTLLVTGLLPGCAPEFDPASELASLRVLAVKKDKPYARPGEDVKLHMLWADASGVQGRTLQIQWLVGCYNPPGDLYSLCLSSPALRGLPTLPDPSALPTAAADAGLPGADAAASPSGVDAGAAPADGAPELSIPVRELELVGGDFPIKLGYGEDFTFRMPERIVEDKPQSSSVPDYGVAYVFFAICAGELRVVQDEDFPLACFDGNRRLGSRDFVAGYTTVYAYEDASIVNHNPVITGLRIGGKKADIDCIGEQCSGLITPSSDEKGACDSSNTLELCDSCSVDIEPLIDQSQPAEDDVVLSKIRGSDFSEQMWINYYLDRGEFGRDLRLLNDAVKGWNRQYAGEYQPREKGTAYLWAVAHDNRGGADWVRARVCIE